MLEALTQAPSTPTDIARATKFHRPSVSRAILELEKKGLAVCFTPDEKLGRIYSATTKGTKVLKLVDAAHKTLR